MDTLLRFLNARAFAVVVSLGLFVYIADWLQVYPRAWYERWANPPQNAPSPLAADMARDLDARESIALRALHKQVTLEIEQAKSRGFQVDRLQALADKALLLDTHDYRPAAMERLNKLRLVIPQPVEHLRPANYDDTPQDDIPTPTSKRAVAPRR